MEIMDIDTKVFSVAPSSLECLFRANISVLYFGGLKKVGTLLVWDTEISQYDSVYSYHAWSTISGQVWDSHKAIKTAMEAHKANGLDFGISTNPEQWKIMQVKFKSDRIPILKSVTNKLKGYRKHKVDAIYLEGYVNISDTKGINTTMQAIADTQSSKFTNEDFLKHLQNYNELE